MTALNTKACSQTNISCVLVGVNQALNAADKTQSDMFVSDLILCYSLNYIILQYGSCVLSVTRINLA